MEAEQQEQQQHACSSFSLVHEASLPSPVVLASWCPTMDLVAVFTADNQLSVHRLSWQRLWTVPLDAHVSAMCWRPDGKALAVGTATGQVTLYDVATCEVLASWAAALAAPGPPPPSRPAAGAAAHTSPASAGAAAVVDLCWQQGPLPGPASFFRQAFTYRHARLCSRPAGTCQGKGPAGQLLPQQAQQQQRDGVAANWPPPAALLDLTATHGKLPWPAAPDALCVLSCTDARGHVSLHALGTFPLARLRPAGPLPAPPEARHAHDATERHDGHGTLQAQAGAAQAGCALSQGLRHLVHVSGGPEEGLPLRVALLDGRWAHRGADVLLRASVMLTHARSLVDAAAAATRQAGVAWKAARGELSQRLVESLKDCLREHAEGAPGAGGAGAGPALGGEGGVGEEGVDPEEEQLVAELVCLLAAGHASPGVRAWLCGGLAEHGVRRLAQQVDAALGGAFALLLDQVAPCLEALVLLLGELRGLSDPLVGLGLGLEPPGEGGAGAPCLGLRSAACGEAERQAVTALLQCEALRAHVTRAGELHRALFTWLLKTVLLLEHGGSAAPAAHVPPGAGPEGAPLTGPAAIAAGASTMQVDVAAVLELLEGQSLLSDPLTPDISEGWVDPDVTPASLRMDPCVPRDQLRQLLDSFHLPPSATLADGKAHGPGAPPGGSGGGGADTWGARDQGPGGGAMPLGGLAAAGGGGGDEEEGGGGARAASLWPSRPFRKQLALLGELVGGLGEGVVGALSQACAPLAQVVLLPGVPSDAASQPHQQQHPGSAATSPASEPQRRGGAGHGARRVWYVDVQAPGAPAGDGGGDGGGNPQEQQQQGEGEGEGEGPAVRGGTASEAAPVVVVAHVPADLMRQAGSRWGAGGGGRGRAEGPDWGGESAAAEQWSGQEAVLFCGLQPDEAAAADGGGAGRVAVRGCLLVLPAGWRVVHLAGYKARQAALLVERPAGGGGSPGAGAARELLLVPRPQLAELAGELGPHHEGASVLQACLSQGAVVQLGVPGAEAPATGEVLDMSAVRARTIAAAPAPGSGGGGPEAAAWRLPPCCATPLAVSASRGVALVLRGGGAVQVLDLEEDEEAGGEEEGEGMEEGLEED